MSDNKWSSEHGKNSRLDGDKTSSCSKYRQLRVIASDVLRQTNSQGLAVAVDGSAVRCGGALGTDFVIAAGNLLTATLKRGVRVTRG